jgi:CRP-like cAMP-binding protein
VSASSSKNRDRGNRRVALEVGSFSEPAGSSLLHVSASQRSASTEDPPFVAARSLKTRLLEGLSQKDKDTILSAASYFRFAADAVPACQGDPADRLFLLINGSARYFFVTPDGRKVYLLWLAPGDIFGGASLLTETADFIVSTEVVRGTEVFVWPRRMIRGLAARFPRLTENVLSTASDYLVWYVASHLSLICHSARRRLANVLISLASAFGSRSSDGINIEVTNEQLANTANITLFTVSRLLSEWHRKGALEKRRGKIVLRSQEELFKTPTKLAVPGTK